MFRKTTNEIDKGQVDIAKISSIWARARWFFFDIVSTTTKYVTTLLAKQANNI